MPWAKTEIVESFWRMLDQVQERLGVRRKKDTKMKIIMGKSCQLTRMSDFVFLVLGLKQYLNPITTKKSKRQSLLWIQIRDEGRSKNNAYFSLIIIISPVTGSGRKFTVPLTTSLHKSVFLWMTFQLTHWRCRRNFASVRLFFID